MLDKKRTNKKIIFIRNGYYPDDPRLKKQVLALLERGHIVEVLCLKKKGQKFIEKENDLLTILRVPLVHKRSNLLWYYLEYSLVFFIFFIIVSTRFLFKKYDYTVVHTLPDFLTFTTIIPKIFGTKVITDFHEPTPELLVTKFKLKQKNILVKLVVFIEQLVIKFSDLSLAVTPALKQRYIERGADCKKLIVISNAVDTSVMKKYIKICSNSKNNSFQLITHGSIEERYGHEIVIKAIYNLKNVYPKLKYVITGSGTYENHLKRLVAELGIQEQIEFKGYLSINELVESLNSSHLGVIPMYSTPYSELIDTNKMYEYFELGIPVALPKLKPLTDNFSPNEVIFFEPGSVESFANTLVNTIINKDKLQKYVLNADAKYQQIKWERVKPSFQKIFDN